MLNCRTVEDAAKAAGISVASAYRWLRDEVVCECLRAARREVWARAMSQLQEAAPEAVASLRRILSEAESEGVQVSAAKILLELGLKAVEMNDIEQRLVKPEQLVKNNWKGPASSRDYGHRVPVGCRAQTKPGPAGAEGGMMAIYKRGDTYWYQFQFNGQRIQQSAQTGKCASKPETVGFYKQRLRLLLVDKKLAGARRNTIDEATVDAYKQRRTRQASRYGIPLSPASVNRELATLRRLLRLAQEWKVLDRVPRIRLLRGEHNREFVLSHKMQPKYLEATPQPLKDVALRILESGIRPVKQ